MIHDYDSLAIIGVQLECVTPCILETYAGGDVVMWQGAIERQITDMAEKASEIGNSTYERLLNKFLNQWKENELDGSLNIETLRILRQAADWASELPWNFKNYFSVLRDRLRKLIAVTGEQLPVMPPEDAKKGGGKPKGHPRLNPDTGVKSQFGPEEPGLEKPADELLPDAEKTGEQMKRDIEQLTRA
jgi:hypothetical protein